MSLEIWQYAKFEKMTKIFEIENVARIGGLLSLEVRKRSDEN